MNRTEIFTKLEEIFKDLLDDEAFELKESDNAESIEEWDSLFQITLVASIEEDFKISLSTTDIAASKTVGALMGVIEKELNKA